MSQDQLLLFPLWYAAFLFSVTCHEAAHAFAAWRGGDPTAYLGGQVSLNPAPHVRREPVGTVLVPLLSFYMTGWMMGWASAPYDPSWEMRHPRRAAWMAAAGPLANLGLALAALALLKGGLVAGFWVPAGDSLSLDRLVESQGAAPGLEGLGRVASAMLTLNLALFLFNLCPLPPLDGASVAAGFLPWMRGLRERLAASAALGLVGLVIAWRVFDWVFPIAYRGVLNWLLR